MTTNAHVRGSLRGMLAVREYLTAQALDDDELSGAVDTSAAEVAAENGGNIVSDLIADLLHVAVAAGEDAHEVVGRALGHYVAEYEDPDDLSGWQHRDGRWFPPGS